MTRSTYLKTLFAVCALALGCGAHAETKDFNVPGGALKKALSAYVKQAGIQLVYKEDDVKGVKTQGVSGALSPEEALAKILSGTELIAHRDSSGAIAIVVGGARLSTSIGSLQQGVILAQGSQAMQNAPFDPPMQKIETESGVGGRGEPSSNGADAQSAESRDARGVPELLVRGRRTSNTDIQRTQDDVQPYVVFDARAIERSMATNLEDFLRKRLPMDTTQSTYSQDLTGGYNGALGNQSQINLRGLGTNQTLILIDGRRAPAVSFSGMFNQPDINGIPLQSVERIEVLPSTASGIYGGGATGGVINIITRRDYDDMEVNGSFNDVFDGSAAERRLGFSAGFTLEGGKTHLMLSGSYSDTSVLLVGERDFAQRARLQQLRNNRAAFYATSSPPFGYTSNICSATEVFPGFGICNSSALVLARGPLAGTSLGFPLAHVPSGYAGTMSDAGAAFLTTAGLYNIQLSDDQNGRHSNLLNNPKVTSYSANLRREFGANFEAFVDLGFKENDGHTLTGPAVSSVLLPAGAANNPFTSAIQVSAPTPGIAAQSLSLLETRNAAGGFLVRLPRRWTAQADYAWSRSRLTFSQDNFLLDADGAAALQGGALDVTRDVNAYPLDFSPYLLAGPTTFILPADTVLRNLTLRLAGPAFDLPGGPLMVSASVERRDQEAKDYYRSDADLAFMGLPPTVTYLPNRWQTTDSVYAEVTAPLVSGRNKLMLVHGLELQASVRKDRYETDTVTESYVQVPQIGDLPPGSVARVANQVESTDYSLGLRYEPTEDVALRVSYGTGFLPPSIHQLASTRNPFSFISVIDPKRNNTLYSAFPITVISGGSPGLLAEQSRSWSGGVIIKPRLLSGLRLSIDYTRIEKTGEITTLMSQALVDNEDALPGRITRAALTAGEIARGYTGGAITAIDTTLMNIAGSRVEAFDLQGDYTHQAGLLGTVKFNVLATWQPSFERRVTPTASVVDSAGFSGGPLEWRINGGITVDRGPWTWGWSAQHYASYYVFMAQSTLATRNADVLSQGSNRIPAQMYHDLFAKYRWDAGAGLFADMEVMLGIQNVFDRDPPIVSSSADFAVTGGYSPYGDPRLRRYTLSLRKRF